MNTLTIECRQKEANLVNKNGDYEVIIPNKIQIEEGDAIVVRNSFIDTEATESQKLVIPDEGLKLTITNLKYLVNWDGTDKKSFETPTDAFPPDGELYAYCHATTTPVNCSEIVSQELEYGGPVATGQDIPWGGGNVTYTYTDFNTGTPQKKVIGIRKLNYDANDKYTIPVNIFFDNTKPTNIAYNFAYNPQFTTPIAPLERSVTEALLNVVTESQTIEIEGGNYDPEDLVVVMNRELQKNRPTGGALVNSPILTATESSGVSTFKFVNFTKNEVFQTENKAYWVGTSDFEFSYIPNSKQFSVNRIHMAYYDSGNEAVGFIPFGGTDTLVTKNSGIMFTNLECELRTSGAPFDFWSGVLGFDLDHGSPNNILATYTSEAGTLGAAPNRRPVFSRFQDGINMTSGYSGLNAVVIKNGTDPFNFVPTSIPATGIFSTSTDVTPIIGKASSLNAQDAFGYFLVEVKAGFGNDFYTPLNNQSSVRAIVSRYYSVNSYTSGTEADSIVYRHNGDPMMLSSFKIRILDSLKNVATNIGEDNTIFIGIIKADKKSLGPK
jgi:hypothetical protein